MAKIYPFDFKAFRRMRLPWLPAMLIPSFILDFIFLYQVITLNPVTYDDSGRLLISELIMVLSANAVFLKSGPVALYFILKHIRGQGKITVTNSKVSYYKRYMLVTDFDYPHPYFIKYDIKHVGSIKLRKSGALVILGDFPVEFSDDQNNIYRQSKKKRCVIPPYYDGMDNIYRALTKLRD